MTFETDSYTNPPIGGLSGDSRIAGDMIQVGKRGVFAMGQAVPIRTDYAAGEVRRLAKRPKDGAQARRLLALAAVLEGDLRGEATRAEGGGVPPLRHRV